jgi:hypothetical protein
MQIIDDIERDLRSHRPPAPGSLQLPASFVWPRYEGVSVGNLAGTVAQLLGGTLPDALPPLLPEVLGDLGQGVKRVVLLVMDGLGWLQLRGVMARHAGLIFHRLADAGRLRPITSTFLSTTNSVLSTIWTGRPPLAHGLLGFELYLREWMMAVESIGFSSPFELFSGTLSRWGFDPETFLPVPSLAQLLAPQGIATVSVIHSRFATTPLSRMHFRGAAEVRGHAEGSDFWLTLRRALEHHRGKRMLLSGYWSAVDSLAHKFGPGDETGEAEVWSMASLMEELFLKRLPEKDRAGTLLLLTADHGLVKASRSMTVVFDRHPPLREWLWMRPVGEGRVPFFYVRDGCYQAAWDYLHEHFGEEFVFCSREQLLESGLLGPGAMYAEVPFRLGDIIGIAKGGGGFVGASEDLDRLAGRHGGLSPEEMLVPLLAVRLDAAKL